MEVKEPEAMAEIHRIREELAKEWELKSRSEILEDRKKIRELIKSIGLKLYVPNYSSRIKVG